MIWLVFFLNFWFPIFLANFMLHFWLICSSNTFFAMRFRWIQIIIGVRSTKVRRRFTHDICTSFSFICEHVKFKQFHWCDCLTSKLQPDMTDCIQVYDHKSVHNINKYVVVVFFFRNGQFKSSSEKVFKIEREDNRKWPKQDTNEL